MIEPFYFDNDCLFGCYHPSSDPASNRALIVCPPLFDEYRRCYRALSDLANACAGNGIHVLRFDYYGTGDSFGLLSETTIETWQHNIDTAIDEIISLTGIENIAVVGIRIGATLASNSKHPAINRFVYWDPIECGAEYLEWLDQVNRRIREEHKEASKYIGCQFENIAYENFHMGELLTAGFSNLNFVHEPEGLRGKTYVITSQEKVYLDSKFGNCEFPGFEHDWPHYFDGILSPKPVLESIAEKVLQP